MTELELLAEIEKLAQLSLLNTTRKGVLKLGASACASLFSMTMLSARAERIEPPRTLERLARKAMAEKGLGTVRMGVRTGVQTRRIRTAFTWQRRK